MVQNNTKIVQALIEALKEVSDLVIKSDVLAQDYKAKFQALGVNLSGTSLTQAQVNAIITFVDDLNALRNSAVVTTVQSKSQPSHGTGALG